MQHSTIHSRPIEHKRHSEQLPLVVVTKMINAPVTSVFHAWSDVDLIKKWWGPAGFSCPYAELDFHVGEKYLFEMKSEEGQEIWSTGVYVEIDPYRTLVFSIFASNAWGEVTTTIETSNGPFSDIATAFVTVEFEDIEDNLTKMTLCHEGLPSDRHDEVAEGWSSSLDKLKEIIEQQH